MARVVAVVEVRLTAAGLRHWRAAKEEAAERKDPVKKHLLVVGVLAL